MNLVCSLSLPVDPIDCSSGHFGKVGSSYKGSSVGDMSWHKIIVASGKCLLRCWYTLKATYC